MSRDQLYPALASGKVDMVAAMVTVRPERGEDRRLLGADAHERQRGRRHRPGRAGDRHCWMIWPVRKCSSARRASTTRARPSERATQGARQAGRRHQRGARRARRRRRARDGQRGTRADHRRRRLSGRVLEPGLYDIKVHRDVAVRSGGALAVALRKENPKLREVVNRGSGSTGRATRSAT